MTNQLPTISLKTSVLFLILLLSVSCQSPSKQFCGQTCMRAKKLQEDRDRMLNSAKYLENKQHLEQMRINGEKEIEARKQREIEEKAAQERRQAEEMRASQDRNAAAYTGQKVWSNGRMIIVVPPCPHNNYSGCVNYLNDFYSKYGAHNCNHVDMQKTGTTSVEAEGLKGTGVGNFATGWTNSLNLRK